MFQEINSWLIGGGLAVGMLFGIIAQRSRFCLVAAVSNWVLIRDYRQVHAFLAALLIATLGTALLEGMGWVDIAASSYRGNSLNWLGALAGGMIFGIGAILAGGCASRTVVRVAEGNLGALVVFLSFALVGMMTLLGVLEPLRGWLDQATTCALKPGHASLSGLLGLPIWLLPILFSLVFLAIIAFTGDWRDNIPLILAGGAVGLVVLLGWWVTGVLAQDEFEPIKPSSLTMAGPLARVTTYLTTGQVAGSGFAIFMFAGFLLGGLLAALLSREFNWVGPASNRVGHYLVGGALMGIGGIWAGGCNIGQGLTGVATLSLQSFLALGGILLGMFLAVWWMQRGDAE